ncbi:MAG TPA: hypothetical protein VI365_34770 [Trebonia sp.]
MGARPGDLPYPGLPSVMVAREAVRRLERARYPVVRSKPWGGGKKP